MSDRIRTRRPLRPEGARPRIDPRVRLLALAEPSVPEEALSRPRRDPRLEKSHRLRRELREAAKVIRTRRDPRADKAHRLRHELRGDPGAGGDLAPVAAVQAAPRHRIVETPAFWVAAVSLATEPWPGAEAETLGVARQMAGEAGGVILIRLGARAGAAEAGAMGADRLVQAEGGLATVMAVLGDFPARHVILAEGFADGDLARRLAAGLGTRPGIGVLVVNDAGVVLRGDGGRSDLFRAAPRIMVLARNRFDPWEGIAGEARLVPVGAAPETAPQSYPEPEGLALLETITLPATDVPLARADFIVSAGEGVTDWPAFHRVAAALGAAEGGSRQVCDAGFLPRARQVGASGTLVEARAYLAFGISGAPQHLQGVQRCRFVLAVNTDLNAAMVKRADLAIIADAQQVMPALARLIGGGA